MYYYNTKTGLRLFEYQAFEHTFLRSWLHLFTYPILYRRAGHFGGSGAPDDFPDITVVRPGGKMMPDVMVSETPLPPPDRELYLSTDSGYFDYGWLPLPKYPKPF
ncbi:hypothetical protein A1Q2_04482 [Trichosporon asahii var. asahii CBS 8904]|uniref:Uncharacterized protein n=1 Tax=Trichosporon asahii var. asahii (strain CBS 8904) TaxID=1220162 RepID=K1WIF2_TRIAC|nr:hypothetical protein A1Q2_04482 [Trichosporon asahii var. asahii CBS 8904]